MAVGYKDVPEQVSALNVSLTTHHQESIAESSARDKMHHRKESVAKSRARNKSTEWKSTFRAVLFTSSFLRTRVQKYILYKML